MNRREQALLDDWLAAEAGADEAAAERALGPIFRLLPEIAPGPDFALRVLAAAGVRVAAPVQRLSWPWRAAIGSGLLVTGLAVIFLLPAAGELTRVIGPGTVIATLVRGFLALIERLVDLLVVGQVVARFGRALAAVVTSLPALVALAALAAFTTVALRSFFELPSTARSPGHVEAP